MRIGSREIGGRAPCLVVAEVGLAHDGSLGMAHAYIDAVAKAGAEAVKFQFRLPSERRCETPMPSGGRYGWSADRTRRDYWRRTGFSLREWADLAGHADTKGLMFLCSTFSSHGASLMEHLLPAWKVASGQVTNGPMLDFMAANPKPTIISAGMATEAELLAALLRLPPAVMLHSRSLYPTPLDQVGLGWPAQAKDDMGGPARVHDRLATELFWGLVPAGISDHSGTIWPSLAAATLGAAMVEVHVTFSRDAYGPDTSSSITLDELRLLCEGTRAIRLCQQPVDREALLRGPLAEARRAYMGEVSA